MADSPRILVVLGTEAAWSRGTLRGFMAAARERGWTLLHYHPFSDLDWLIREWSPAAVVLGNDFGEAPRERFEPAALVSVTVDRSADGVASVCIDEARVAELAVEHLVDRGIKNVSTFRYDESPFAVARERAFVARARALGIHAAPGWGDTSFTQEERAERPAAIIAWLRSLPAPCGVFTCTDGWGRTVARYAREAGIRIPDRLAVVGADNDVLECELNSPPLSSVMIPWELVGRGAAALVESAISKPAKPNKRVVVAPTGVEARRSTDLLAIEDPVVAEALSWISQNAERPLSVPMVARAVGGGRQRLERRFRAVLDRTVQEAIRQAHIEVARRLLATSDASLSEIAKRSGFTSASLLNAAFQRELGTSPGAYRRRAQKQAGKPDDD